MIRPKVMLMICLGFSVGCMLGMSHNFGRPLPEYKSDQVELEGMNSEKTERFALFSSANGENENRIEKDFSQIKVNEAARPMGIAKMSPLVFGTMIALASVLGLVFFAKFHDDHTDGHTAVLIRPGAFRQVQGKSDKVQKLYLELKSKAQGCLHP